VTDLPRNRGRVAGGERQRLPRARFLRGMEHWQVARPGISRAPRFAAFCIDPVDPRPTRFAVAHEFDQVTWASTPQNFGISTTRVISDILNGKRSISKTHARKLSEFFHVPVSLFM
jgi:hypothetical protein